MVLRRGHVLVSVFVGAAVISVLAAAAWLIESPQKDESPADASAVSESTLQGSFVELDVPTWAAAAQVIVIGRVQGTQVPSQGVALSKSRREQLQAEGYSDGEIDSWVAFEDSIVFTTSQVKISETLKGDLAGTIQVRHRGGTYRGHSTAAEGFPQLHPGREYLLVLSLTFDGACEVANAYEIDKGMATSTLGGRTESWPLDELVALIRQHANDPNPFVVDESVEATASPEPSPVPVPAAEASQTAVP